MSKTKLDETYIFRISVKIFSFDVDIGIKILFFRVLVTIVPRRSLLQFVTTNCLKTNLVCLFLCCSFLFFPLCNNSDVACGKLDLRQQGMFTIVVDISKIQQQQPSGHGRNGHMKIVSFYILDEFAFNLGQYNASMNPMTYFWASNYKY